MIFGIDVRRRICNTDRKWMDYVDIKSHLKSLVEDVDENNEEIKEKLKEALKIFEDIEALKRQDLHDEIHRFEQEFVKEVKTNQFLYGD